MAGGLNPMLRLSSQCFPFRPKLGFWTLTHHFLSEYFPHGLMEPCLRTGSRNSNFYVDLKGTAQNTWAHTHFLWKFAISDATDDFIWNIYINRTCISLFWIQAYQISYYRTIVSKVNKMFTYFAFSGFWPPPPNFFYPTAFPSDEIFWSLDQYLQNDTKNETFARIRNYWVSIGPPL